MPTAVVTTSSSVLHSPCGASRTVKVKPRLSTLAGALDVITVERTNVSRWYSSQSSLTFARSR
jgi:hypothetical protein